MVFNAKLVRDPGVMVLKMISFLKYWKPLQRTKDMPKLEEVEILEGESGRVVV